MQKLWCRYPEGHCGSDAARWKLGQDDAWRGGPLTRNPRYWKKDETRLQGKAGARACFLPGTWLSSSSGLRAVPADQNPVGRRRFCQARPFLQREKVRAELGAELGWERPGGFSLFCAPAASTSQELSSQPVHNNQQSPLREGAWSQCPRRCWPSPVEPLGAWYLLVPCTFASHL